MLQTGKPVHENSQLSLINAKDKLKSRMLLAKESKLKRRKQKKVISSNENSSRQIGDLGGFSTREALVTNDDRMRQFLSKNREMAYRNKSREVFNKVVKEEAEFEEAVELKKEVRTLEEGEKLIKIE